MCVRVYSCVSVNVFDVVPLDEHDILGYVYSKPHYRINGIRFPCNDTYEYYIVPLLCLFSQRFAYIRSYRIHTIVWLAKRNETWKKVSRSYYTITDVHAHTCHLPIYRIFVYILHKLIFVRNSVAIETMDLYPCQSQKATTQYYLFNNLYIIYL